MEQIFSAGGQVFKVWFVFGIVLVTAVILTLLSGFCGLPIGLALVISMAVYASCYTSRIYYDPTQNRLKFETLIPIGTAHLSVRPGDIARTTFNDGFFAGHVTTNAPWYSIYIKGRVLPLIVDAQGKFFGPQKAASFFCR